MLYSNVLLFHSLVRYFVFLVVIVVLVRSFLGWTQKKGYSKIDDKLSVWLLMMVHTQALLGLILYFVSPHVKFDGNTMKEALQRYWTVEHIFMMVIAVALITVARITTKKISDEPGKHRRMFILCGIAFLIIVVAIATSGRGFFSLPA